MVEFLIDKKRVDLEVAREFSYKEVLKRDRTYKDTRVSRKQTKPPKSQGNSCYLHISNINQF